MRQVERDPLAATLARITALETSYRYERGAGDGAGWFALQTVQEDGDLVDSWLDCLEAGVAKGHRQVAGSLLVVALATIVVRPVTAAILADRRTWRIAPDVLSVHPHSDGWFDAVAVGSALRVLPGDDAADLPDVVVVPDSATMRAELAAGLVDTLAHIFDRVRESARIGRPGMWSAVADVIADAALTLARQAGRDGEEAWSDATALIDTVQFVVPEMRARPSLERLTWSGGITHFAVRSSCCLYFRVSDCAADRRGDGYCANCPLRAADDRRRRMGTLLEQQATAASSAVAG